MCGEDGVCLMDTIRHIWIIVGTYAILAWFWVLFEGIDPHEVTRFQEHPDMIEASDLVLDRDDINGLDRAASLSVIKNLSLEDANAMGLCVLKDDHTYVVQDATGHRRWMPANKAVYLMDECWLQSDFGE